MRCEEHVDVSIIFFSSLCRRDELVGRRVDDSMHSPYAAAAAAIEHGHYTNNPLLHSYINGTAAQEFLAPGSASSWNTSSAGS